MAISSKIGIGAAIVIVGLAGLIYSMPLASNAAAAKTLILQESDVPKYPAQFMEYVAIEIVSAFIIVGGIAMLSLGLVDTLQFKNHSEEPSTRKTTHT